MRGTLRTLRWTQIMMLVLAGGLAACGGDSPKDWILKHEDGTSFSMLPHWWISTEAGSSGTFSMGDLRGSFRTDDGDRVHFDYELVRSYQLPSGYWINELDMTIIDSESALFEPGRTYYITLYIFTMDIVDVVNLVIDDSLPYPVDGAPYPSATFPLFRQFAS